VKLVRKLITREVGVALTADDPYLGGADITRWENYPNDTEEDKENGRHRIEELKGVVEWFSKWELDQGSDQGFALEIDRATTNIFQPYLAGGRCGYCDEEHRTSDCLPIWD
jgi:hypothetical protein